MQKMAGPPGLNGPIAPPPAGVASNSADGHVTASTASVRVPLSRPGTATCRNVTSAVSYKIRPTLLLCQSQIPGKSFCAYVLSQTGWRMEPLVTLVFMLCDLWRGSHDPNPPLQLPHTTDGRNGLPGKGTSDQNLQEVRLS